MKIDINISFSENDKEEFRKWVEAQVLDLRCWIQDMMEYGVELNPPLPHTEAEKEPQEPEKPKVAEEGKEEKPAEPIKLEEVRAKLAALSQSGKQAEVKELITSFGAKKLTDISVEKYPELMEKASEIA